MLASGMNPTTYGYIPVAIFFAAAVVVPLALLGVSRLLSHRVYGEEKLKPYECGVDPIGGARERFSVRYYLIAMLFLIFDVEAVFLIPWGVIFDKLSIFGLIEMLVSSESSLSVSITPGARRARMGLANG